MSKNPTFANHTGVHLVVAGARGTRRIVRAGEKLALGPKSGAPWSVAFAEGAKPLGALRIHVMTDEPLGETSENAQGRFAVASCADGFVACRLPSPS